MSPIRILIADDHTLLREGIKALLAAEPDFEIVGEAQDGEQAIAACRRLDPDIVLMDVAMPGLGGLEAALTLRRDCPRTRVLVLTQYEDREYVSRFLEVGAAGYILKKAAGTDLVAAIRAVQRGGLVLDPGVARDALTESRDPARSDLYAQLTDREKQVLRLVAEGKATKEIAGVLGISVKTAMSHREHLMQKLGVHNRTELVKFAVRHGVITL